MVGKWNMISLGRGFYEFVFSSIEDMRTIWATGSWNLKPGILRLSLWTPDFNLWLQRITHSQCWIKITGLPQEYWCPSIIFTIAGGIGMPISIDEATTRRSFGHFARVLVDIDLKNSVPTQMLVERDGFEFFVCIDVENMPAFYTGCQAIGHVVSKCRRSSKMVVDEVAKPMARKAQLPVVKPTSVNIVIDLDIEDVNTLGMERLMLNPEDTHSESSAEAVDKTLHNESSLDIVGKVLQNESDPDILGKALQSGSASVDSNVNLIVTEELRPVAARDMAIVGRLWGENENDKVNPLFWASLKLKGFGFNDRGNMRPNIWGLCDIGLNPNLLATSTKHITSSLEVENKLIFINAVYTHNSYLHKRQLWAEIQTLMNDNQGPWCYIGDFNVVLGAHECRGPNLPPILPSAEFQLFTDARCLIHLATRGADFTWTNRRRGVAETEKSLDICIVNEDWMTVWNQISCSTLPRIASDHHPLLLCFSLASVPRPSAFKFHKMWLSHVDCQRLVAETWRVEVVGCPLFVLSQKLRLLKKELKVWNFQVFGNIHERVKTALASVAAIQEVLNSSGHDEDLLEQEHLAQNELLQALVMEEKFWQDKARLSWQNEGDRNTSFFLKTTKIRQASKALSTLRDGDNILVGQEEIDQHTLAYFTDLYATPNNVRPNHLIQYVIPALVFAEDNIMLSNHPSIEEIRGAVFDLNGEGDPGPYGFGGCFYQHFSDIVGEDVCKSVGQFFRESWLLPNLNSNNIALIPKYSGAYKIEDFRPIALANFQFKIITKILASRLAVIAPKIVSPLQRGFIKDNNIQDCICLASEAANLLDYKTFGGNLAIKLDIKKEFDTLDWKFLQDTLCGFGFNAKFVHWVKIILHSAMLSINVNGEYVGFFKGLRGVRQGDPLSPLFFCLRESSILLLALLDCKLTLMCFMQMISCYFAKA
ncbi:putative RNA-directed DNA polymerase [Lupinus albus]|uniref:Putative RNA-directed DNA polymerase n=1 Tax=Lupinus albus TaxID=3870 RepID=A0A6A4PH46_LUPAL|nr:putative RNA-directed DNA polymerase [Lupinus albus]